MPEVEKRGSSELTGLASEINQEHQAFVGSLKKTAEHGIRAGELLYEAKSQCKHGEWTPWLQANFEGSVRTAQSYMKLYENREEILGKTNDGAVLGIAAARELLSATSEPDPFEEVFAFVEREAKRHAETPVYEPPAK